MSITTTGRAARGDERGSASVLGVQVLVLVSVVSVVCCAVTALFAAHRRAEAAADLGALAGATAVQRGGEACPAAAAVVRRNHAVLRSCRVTGQTVRLEVAVTTVPLLGRSRTLAATAVAGPAEPSAGRSAELSAVPR